MAFAIMTAHGAARRNFPRNPKPGEVVYSDGQAWVWYPPSIFESNGLSEFGDGLGFWGALIGTAIGGISSLFGGGKDKKTQQAIQEQQQQIAALQAQLDEEKNRPKGVEAILNKKTLPYLALLVFGFLVLR